MAIEIQFTANTGIATIDTANSNLDGTGTFGVVLTAGMNGSVIKTLVIKALQNTSKGMIRFFVSNGSGYPKLIMEVPVINVTCSGRDRSFSRIINVNISLSPGEVLCASTEQAETFNIIALGMDWQYNQVRSDKSVLFANTGIIKIDSANPYRDGTGEIVQAMQAGSTGYTNGCVIKSINIKAQQTVSPGMIRLFLTDQYNVQHLFYELVIPYFNQTATGKSYAFNIFCKGWLKIQYGFGIAVSTENAESFGVIINGFDWTYPS